MKDRLRKIYELSIRGVDGERENAHKLLESLLAKHNLTLEDLIGEERIDHVMKFRNNLERKLTCQVVAHVAGNPKAWSHGKHRYWTFSLTASEIVEIELLYGEYKKAFAKEQDRLLSAFIAANNIYPEKSGESKELTMEELIELRRVMRMASNLSPVEIGRKRLSA